MQGPVKRVIVLEEALLHFYAGLAAMLTCRGFLSLVGFGLGFKGQGSGVYVKLCARMLLGIGCTPLYMQVCVCIYTYTYAYKHTYTCMYIDMYTYT